MKQRTQSVQARVRAHRWTAGLAASVLLLICFGIISPVAAQQGGNQAGLLIQFGDGSVFTACVDLGPDGEMTGEELLRALGLSTLIDYNSGFGGGTVCKIGNQGCNFPAEHCFCQCTMKPGDPCIYWTYFFQPDGQWRYSNLGISSLVARPGDVQGWVWGPGGSGTGTLPPHITFEQICSNPSQVAPPPAATATPVPAATFTPLPILTSTISPPTETLAPTDTPLPSALPSPTEPWTPTHTAPPATAGSSPTSIPRATNTALPSFTPSSTPTPEPSASQTPTWTPQTVALDVSTKDPQPFLASSDNEGKSAGSTSNYIVFGVLIVVLVGGLIFMRIR